MGNDSGATDLNGFKFKIRHGIEKSCSGTNGNGYNVQPEFINQFGCEILIDRVRTTRRIRPR